MSRIACLRVPSLPLAALLRVKPELRGLPFVVADCRTLPSLVLAVSVEAAKAGVAPGLTLDQARSVCGRLVVRQNSVDTVDAAIEALAEVAGSISARVEVGGDGAVFLDCEGAGALYASESEIATVLLSRAERQGLSVGVGIGGSKLVAQIAAREDSHVRIVPRGSEAAYLAPFPIALLCSDDTLAEIFTCWGIRRIGDLAALPPGEVAHRLGPVGARLARQARGEDHEPLQSRPAPVSFGEAAQLDYGVERVDGLLFVLRRLVDRMVNRLALRGSACGEFEVRLDLEDGGREQRRLTVAVPTGDAKVLLMLIRAHLEREPPPRGVTGVAIVGTPVNIRPVQLDFFQPGGPSPTALTETLARLALLCGPDRIGTPVPAITHRPGTLAMGFFLRRTRSAQESGACSEGRALCAGRAAAAGDPHLSLIRGAPGSLESTAPIVFRTAMRALRPAVPLEVLESGKLPDYVCGPGFGGRVVHVAGPWWLRGEWWTADPYAREYYDLELSNGSLYRIYRDVRTDRWLADGIYD